MNDFLEVFGLADFYKIGHIDQYPDQTRHVYSTWIPRTSRLSDVDRVVSFGFQAFLSFLNDIFINNFFSSNPNDIVRRYQTFMKYTLGVENADAIHWHDLHSLGYLPLEIKAIPEGMLVPLRVPAATIENTMPEFFWLTNFIETIWSNMLWLASTSATIAHEYRKTLDRYAMETTGSTEGVEFQAHDFSMRGLTGLDATIMSGMGHLLSFVGTDSIPAIYGAMEYYGANIAKSLVGTSVPATEHSVMCAGGADNEYETYRRLIEDIYPTGIVSIVSDTWDLWHVITNILPDLAYSIMHRDGRVVIRPDSGNPTKIICGDPDAVPDSPAYKGVIQLLWEIFGGTTNDKGYKVLDPHIGAIYGDSITRQICTDICEGLKQKGFASTNMVFGVGSFTYQYNTRDTFGWAMKATWVDIDGEEKAIFKDPKTDNGVKKSLRGRVVVLEDGNTLKAIDGLTKAEQESYGDRDMLKTIYKNGRFMRFYEFTDIRNRLANER